MNLTHYKLTNDRTTSDAQTALHRGREINHQSASPSLTTMVFQKVILIMTQIRGL